MVSTNDVRPGMALALPDGLFSIISHEHVKPGKGKAFVRMKLRKIETGQVLDRTFRADEEVPRAIVEQRQHQYLYRDDLGYHFMNLEDYSQFALGPDLVDEAAPFLLEGASVSVTLHEGNAIGIDLPTTVELEVTESEPAVKGDRVSGATKPVTTETGLVVQVPLFVTTGDRIKVDTRSGEYLTRV